MNLSIIIQSQKKKKTLERKEKKRKKRKEEKRRERKPEQRKSNGLYVFMITYVYH